jgi:FMN phosphatase YigB (HAD superfamily)
LLDDPAGQLNTKITTKREVSNQRTLGKHQIEFALLVFNVHDRFENTDAHSCPLRSLNINERIKQLEATCEIGHDLTSDKLFPHALDVVDHVKQWGRAVILSDGDVVFQPRKIERSGLFAAVDGNVLIYIHKEQELDDVERRYPADHYVLVDDKLRILTAVKKGWDSRVTTVFPRQGHYARDPQAVTSYPAPDLAIEQIGDLLKYDLHALLALAPSK